MIFKKKSFYLALAPVFFLLLFSLIGSFLTPYDPFEQQLQQTLLPPSSEYICGTDRYGRCVFSRILAGAPLSVFTALFLTAAAALIGTAAGMCSGYYRGSLIDKLLQHLTNIVLAFPGIILALAITGIAGGGMLTAAFALLCSSWAPYARLVRRQIITVSQAPYIEAARLSGCTDTEILCRYLLPIAAKPVLIMAAANIGTMLLTLSGLSFLGLGAQPPAAEWGAMISSSRSLLQVAPWTVFTPGGALFIAVCCFNFSGNALHDLLEPEHNNFLKEYKDE